MIMEYPELEMTQEEYARMSQCYNMVEQSGFNQFANFKEFVKAQRIQDEFNRTQYLHPGIRIVDK